jgi:uncharacterized integral membrane protein
MTDPGDLAAPPTERAAPTTVEVELVPPPPSTSDWPTQATDTIVNLIDQVRAKTTGPAVTVARGLVFGVIVGVLGLIATVLLLVFAVRLTTEVLVSIWDGAGVWLTYLIYGTLFTVVGAVVFAKRRARDLG